MMKADEVSTPLLWYTVVHDERDSQQLAKRNPWNQEDSTFEKRCYLMDDCVVTFRPARCEDRIVRQQDYNKGLYFVEIANQDSSLIFTSRRVYSWEEGFDRISYFKGLSFTAATRIWKAKKL